MYPPFLGSSGALMDRAGDARNLLDDTPCDDGRRIPRILDALDPRSLGRDVSPLPIDDTYPLPGMRVKPAPCPGGHMGHAPTIFLPETVAWMAQVTQH